MADIYDIAGPGRTIKPRMSEGQRTMLRATNDDIPIVRAFDLRAFAISLCRPVRRGWMSSPMAEAALLLAVDRFGDATRLAETWQSLCQALPDVEAMR